MDTDVILVLLGIILTSIISQTTAVWVRFSSLEKKMEKNKCPFGECPLYERAKTEAVEERKLSLTLTKR